MSSNWSERTRRLALPGALAGGAALILWQGNTLLLSHGPPMLARDARAFAIVMVLGAYWLVLAAMAAAIRLAASRLAGAMKVAAVIACAAAAAAVLIWTNSALFALAHAACYVAGLCRWTSLPESIMYTMAVSSKPPVIAVCVVLPVLVLLLLRPQREASP